MIGWGKLKLKIWIIFITLLISLMSKITSANEVNYKTKRVPAEWETHEATWMQWPGYWEKDYEITNTDLGKRRRQEQVSCGQCALLDETGVQSLKTKHLNCYFAHRVSSLL